MNTHDIELPEPKYPGTKADIPNAIPDLYTADQVRAAIEPYAKRIEQLEAARFAYASEFPPNEDGDPDVGSIHENIRKLKAALEADRKRKGEVVVTKAPEGEIIAVTRQDDEGRILSVIAEADSKRRGEPVAWIRVAKTWDGEPVVVIAKPHQEGAKPVYLAPQPAENSVNLEVAIQAISALHSNDTDWDTSYWNQAVGRCVSELNKLRSQQPAEPVVADAPVPSDESTRKWKRIEEYSREMDGKKIDIYLGDFLLYCPQLEDEGNNGVVVGYYSEPYKGWYTSETLEEVLPTHFMPLPEKPL